MHKTLVMKRWEISLAFIVLTISFVTAVAWGTHLSHEVRAHDHDQIVKIQQGRLESCERTYEGIRQAFQPFFARSRKTAKGRHDLEIFNQRINALKAQCPAQIHAGDNP